MFGRLGLWSVLVERFPYLCSSTCIAAADLCRFRITFRAFRWTGKNFQFRSNDGLMRIKGPCVALRPHISAVHSPFISSPSTGHTLFFFSNRIHRRNSAVDKPSSWPSRQIPQCLPARRYRDPLHDPRPPYKHTLRSRA